VRWLWNVVQLDLGLSIAYRVGVADLIGTRATNTVILAVASMVFTWTLAIPIGVLVGLRPNTISDRLLSFLAFFGMSIPNFFLAFLLMFAALQTGWFPIGGTTSVDYSSLSFGARIVDRLHHLVLPVIVLGTSGMASLMRLMRANVLELKEADFVRTARAKGLDERAVVGKHILRNALNPFVTLAGYELGALLSGAALVEAVMNLQGLGSLMLEAVRSLDVYLVMGSVLMGSLLLLAGNLLADLALTLVDPRIDFEKRNL
jgi:peptide/nickel transport system permease protein